MTLMLWLLGGVIFLSGSGYVCARIGAHPSIIFLLCSICQVIYAVGALLTNGSVVAIAIDLTFAAVWFVVYLRLRPPRDRRKVVKLIGAKARAVLEKVKAAMPHAKPHLRPAPGAMFGFARTTLPRFPETRI